MHFNLRGIAAFAIATTLAAIVLFTPTRSLSAMPPQSGGGLSITFGVGQKPDAPYSVTCESRSHRRTYCAADTRGGATLQQQFPASAPCVFGNTWGADAEGVWVEGGCRGTFVVNPYNGGGPWWWDPGNGHRPPSQGIPRRGACFFKERNYRGEYFCMNSGASFNLLPPGFNDKISSIQVYGRVSMVIYNDANFRGENVAINRSVSDLSAWRLPSNSNKNWNNRISSIQVN